MANKIITTDTLKTVLTNVADTINETNEQINKPLTVSIEYPNNIANVNEDASGIKYDMIESPESTIELNGKTLVNLWGNKRSDFYVTYFGTKLFLEDGYFTANANGNNIFCSCYKKELFKPNTNYTIICEVVENTLEVGLNLNQYHTENIFPKTMYIETGKTGIFVFNDTTVAQDAYDNATRSLRSYVYQANTTGKVKFRCIILEGDYTNVPIKYFEGLKSAGETNKNTIEVLSVGKNLLDCSIDKIKYRESRPNVVVTELANNRLLVTSPIVNNMFGWIAKVKPNTTYIVNDFHNVVVDDVITWTVRAYGFSDEPTFIHSDNEPRINTPYSRYDNHIKFTTTSDTKYMAIGYHTGAYEDKLTEEIPKPSLIEGDIPQEYEPYKESIQTIELSEPLRSLPNGVCDEAFIHDDKLVITRNTEQITLNGTEEWQIWSGTSDLPNTYCFMSVTKWENSLDVSQEDANTAISDSITKYRTPSIVNQEDVESFAMHKKIYMRIARNKLSDYTANSLKTYLSNNPFEVVYQLATPTYEWYELPSPHLYKEGNLFIETGAIPLTSNTHEIDVSVRSVIDTNVEEIMEIKEELNNLDLELMTVEESNGIWQGLLKGVNE